MLLYYNLIVNFKANMYEIREGKITRYENKDESRATETDGGIYFQT